MKTERGERTRLALIMAAGELLSKKHINNVSVLDITKMAGVAKGTFYVHFATKDDVIWDFLELTYNRSFQDLIVEMDKNAENTDTHIIIDCVIACICENLTILKKIHQPQFQAYLRAMAFKRRYEEEWEVLVQRWLEKGMSNGSIAQMDPVFLSRFVTRAIHETMNSMIIEGTESALENSAVNLKIVLSRLIYLHNTND